MIVTKRAWILLLAILPALPVLAQGKDDLLKQARALEKRASALLDQGKRGEAFDLLARAAELRERAKIADKGKAAPKEKQPKPKPKRARLSHMQQFERSLKGFDAAVQAGDMKRAREAAQRTRGVLLNWARSLEKAQPDRTARRVARLEKQVAELRKMIAEMGR